MLKTTLKWAAVTGLAISYAQAQPKEGGAKEHAAPNPPPGEKVSGQPSAQAFAHTFRLHEGLPKQQGQLALLEGPPLAKAQSPLGFHMEDDALLRPPSPPWAQVDKVPRRKPTQMLAAPWHVPATPPWKMPTVVPLGYAPWHATASVRNGHVVFGDEPTTALILGVASAISQLKKHPQEEK